MGKMQILVKSIYAGFVIGIGGIIYLSVENKIMGSLLFSFGLLTIVTQEFYLYTGKIGFVKEFKELPDMLITICGNYTGTILTAGLAHAAQLKIDSSELVEMKLGNNLWNVFFLSILCGIMMYLAIDNYHKNKNIVFIIAPVMIFILSGFEHSIANMFYFNLAGSFNFKSFGYILTMLAGNGIGARVFGIRPYHA